MERDGNRTTRRRPALEIAAQTASTSYRGLLPVSVLREALLTGVVPVDWSAHFRALFDEAPIETLGRVAEQIFVESKVPRARTWSNMKHMALELRVLRDFWHTMNPDLMGPDGGHGKSWFELNSL
jgi:hypothetical protein